MIAAAIAALSLVLPVWAAALIVAVALFAVAGIAGLVSKKQLTQAAPTPTKTVANDGRPIRGSKNGTNGVKNIGSSNKASTRANSAGNVNNSGGRTASHSDT